MRRAKARIALPAFCSADDVAQNLRVPTARAKPAPPAVGETPDISRGTGRASAASMATSNQPVVVLVGVDYSDTGDLAFDRALALCRTEPNAALHVVNVAPMILGVTDVEHALIPDPKKRTAEVESRLLAYVEKKVGELQKQGTKLPERIRAHVRWEVPGEEIAQLAADLEADLVVVGTHGRRGFSRAMMGSVAELVVRLAPCPVLVVRPKGVPKVPAIEPPCPECVKARTASAGATYWCEQHSERHGQRHTYHSSDRVAADGSFPLLFHG
jgi:nucleotide-binding universal stress UspA family protein